MGPVVLTQVPPPPLLCRHLARFGGKGCGMIWTDMRPMGSSNIITAWAKISNMPVGLVSTSSPSTRAIYTAHGQTPRGPC